MNCFLFEYLAVCVSVIWCSNELVLLMVLLLPYYAKWVNVRWQFRTDSLVCQESLAKAFDSQIHGTVSLGVCQRQVVANSERIPTVFLRIILHYNCTASETTMSPDHAVPQIKTIQVHTCLLRN